MLAGAALLVFLITTAFTCSKTPTENLTDNQQLPPMTNDNYPAAWKTVDSLDKEGLPKSALEIVTGIYKRAKSENNYPQIIKSVLFRSKYVQQTEEESMAKVMQDWQEEIRTAEPPSRQILQSVLAQIVDAYRQNNQWRLQNRTETRQFDNQDIKTWSAEELSDYSAELYSASLQNPELLQAQSLADYAAITTEGNTAELRPTLYDFLAHRAIDFFMNEQNHLTQPVYNFRLENPAVFAYTNEFVNTKFPTKDAQSFKKKTLILFQDLLKFRQKDGNRNALADVELKRLIFVHANAVMNDKDALYLSALEKLYSSYESEPVAAMILYRIGMQYFDKGVEYDRRNPAKNGDDYRNGLTIALEKFEKAAEQYLNTPGAAQALQQINTLRQKGLMLTAEIVNLPNKSVLAQLEYRNADRVHVKVIPWNDDREEKLQKLTGRRNNGDLEAAKYLNGLEVLQKASYDLPGTEDLRQHTTEIAFEPMPYGEYLLVAGSEEDFSLPNNFLGWTHTTVSELGYWAQSRSGEEGGQKDFVAYHRATGQPLAGVKAEFFITEYNSIRRSYDLRKAGETVSDKDGFFSSTVPQNARRSENYRVRLSKGEDVLFLKDNYSDYQYNRNRRPRQTVQFFTDRAIYRPGQTVYFKGLLLNIDKEQMPTAVARQKVTVVFRDANYQKIADLKLTSGEYGTFHGSFTAPQGGLLGNMSLVADGFGQTNIRVEEYKRPKFEVKLDPVQGSFALNEEITVTGKAIAFAGNNIDGAQVTYRVSRQARFPYLPWWYYRGGGFPSSPAMEITNGTAVTDTEGKFSITFTALPDPDIAQENKPVFTYTVTADVTDITGETQTGTQNVRASYTPLVISADLPDQIVAKELTAVALNTKNLSGEHTPTQGTFKLELLDAPDRVFVNRYWEKPEFKLLSEAEFVRKFPHLAYDSEDEPQNWDTARTAIETSFDTGKEKEITLSGLTLAPGIYRAKMQTKDAAGKELKWEKLVTVVNLGSDKSPVPEVGFHYRKDKFYEPGEQVGVWFGAAESDLRVLFAVEKNKKIVSRKWLTVNGLKSELLRVEESDRGNFFYHFNYARHNRSYGSDRSQGLVRVPWSNKDLQIEYTTFRDKMLPGAEEEWQIKISGPKGDKVAAEMLATMYDASLDAFVKHGYNLSLYPNDTYSYLGMTKAGYSESRMTGMQKDWQQMLTVPSDYYRYQELDLFGFQLYERSPYMLESVAVMDSAGGIEMRKMSAAPARTREAVAEEAEALAEDDMTANQIAPPPPVNKPEDPAAPVQIRENLNETVFFYPNLQTDAEGNVIVKFTMNEALTRWKFLGLATTKDLQYGLTEKEVITQKDLMVMPNAPRFFRENDEIEFTAKVVNLSDRELSGSANLELINPLTGDPVFVDADFPQKFTVPAGQSARLAWYFNVPEVSEVPVIQHTVSARAGDFSDAERSVTPVLTNRMLVTETMPLPVRGGERKTFTFKSMQQKWDSPTMDNESLTLEFTSNPAWYAVQALPYLMEYPYECTEQIFSRYYANTLATSVANAHPRVKTVFEQWRDREPQALMSNLSKNEELKTAILEETPWVLQARSEEQQKRNIGLLFDLNKMANEQASALRKLRERQLPSGGFAWFPGGKDDWYITQYLTEGLAHLDKLGVADVTQDAATWQMTQNAVRYCDREIAEYYEDLQRRVKKSGGKMSDYHLSDIAVHYLYMRTFFLENTGTQAAADGGKIQQSKKFLTLDGKAQEAFEYFAGQAEEYWLKNNLYSQGMIALALQRINRATVPAKIVKSLKEKAVQHEELGMYFKGETGYNWYQLPVERHALLIEVMDDVARDAQAVNDMKVWLLKNKQTNHWKTTKSTAAAVYALLSTGDNWLAESAPAEISFTASSDSRYNEQIKQAQQNAEAGTGYFKTRIAGDKVQKSLATVEVNNPNTSVAWGGLYWQYFEQLDKIETFEDTPLQLKKQLFKVMLTDTGEKIIPVNTGDKLNPGDKLKVRIELRVDRPMEYVHMKDGRASGFEPLNVLSTYKYQGGLGYYESTRDASTDFFFSYLPKGTHVFEYPIRVVHKGNFSNGVTTVQCMYAPEFTSHSEGVRVEVE